MIVLEAELTIKEGQGIGTSCRLFPWILLLYKDVNLNDTDITNACKTQNSNFHSTKKKKKVIPRILFAFFLSFRFSFAFFVVQIEV